MMLGEDDTVMPETEAPADEPASLDDEQGADPVDEQDELSAEGDGGAVQPDADYDDVEYEGEVYRLPKKLKDAVLRQADYTRKTQEVAETRRALEAREREIVQQAEAFRADAQERATLVAYDRALAQYQNVDWDKWEQNDPLAAQKGWRQLQQMRSERDNLAMQLIQKDEQRAREVQQSVAKRLEETESVLRRDVKGWGPEMARQLNAYGQTQGLTTEEIDSIVDHRLVKILHKAMLYDQSRTAKSGGQAASVQRGAVPLTAVQKGKAPATRVPLSKTSMDDYVRRRAAGEMG